MHNDANSASQRGCEGPNMMQSCTSPLRMSFRMSVLLHGILQPQLSVVILSPWNSDWISSTLGWWVILHTAYPLSCPCCYNAIPTLQLTDKAEHPAVSTSNVLNMILRVLCYDNLSLLTCTHITFVQCCHYFFNPYTTSLFLSCMVMLNVGHFFFTYV